MAYLFARNNLSGIMQLLPLPDMPDMPWEDKSKDSQNTAAPPPVNTTIPDDPADYQQDPACPEGQRRQEGSQTCENDPIYIELMARLNEELKALEREEAKLAEEARLAAAQEQLRAEMEQRRIEMDEQRRIQRIEEETQVKRLAILGIGGLGALTVITLIVKLILR